MGDYIMENFKKDVVWKSIPGFEGLYKVSNTGEVYSEISSRTLKQIANNRGYMMLNLSHKGIVVDKNRKSNKYLVHRLVASAFIDNPENLPQIDHIDVNKKNNNVENLEWVNNSENNKRAFKNGLKKVIVSKEQADNHSKVMKNLYKENPERFSHLQKFEGKKIYQIDRNGKVVGEYSSVLDASEKTGISSSSIYNIFTSNMLNKSAGGFFWTYNLKEYKHDESYVIPKKLEEIYSII